MSLIICGQDNTIISTAPIYISGEFHFLQDVGWYSSVYTLVVCTTQLLFSKLIARYSICWIHTIAIISVPDRIRSLWHCIQLPQPSQMAVQSLRWDVPAS